MTAICQSCGAEIASDAASCWNCDATGEAMRGAKRGSSGSSVIWLVVAIVLVGAGSSAAWWWTQQPGLASAPSQVAATPPAPSVEPAGSGEAYLMADPIDGPFYREFKQTLPADYAATVGALLVQVTSPSKEPEKFDQLLSEKLEAFQADNARAIAGAETGVLAGMADSIQLAMRMPQVCQAAMATTYTPLSQRLVDARRAASASNLAMIRAVASGRIARVSRSEPDEQQTAAFNAQLKSLLTAGQWTSFQQGGMSGLSLDEQCKIMSSFWSVIAGYPDDLSARWTASQMLRLGPTTPQ